MKTETPTPLPGTPTGYRPVRFGKPLESEQFVATDGRIKTAEEDYAVWCCLIVEPIPEDPLPDGTRLVTDEERRTKKKPAKYWWKGVDAWYEGVISDVWWATAAQYAIPIDTVLEGVEPIPEQHQEPQVCHWSEDRYDNWLSGCGFEWALAFEGVLATPSNQGMEYCPKCGASIIQHDYEEHTNIPEEHNSYAGVNPHENIKRGVEKHLYKTFKIDWDHDWYPVFEQDRSLEAIIGILIKGYRIFGYTDDPDWNGGHDQHWTHSCDRIENRKYAIGRLEE